MNIGKSMLAASTFAGALFLASTIAPLPGLAQGVGADGTAPGPRRPSPPRPPTPPATPRTRAARHVAVP